MSSARKLVFCPCAAVDAHQAPCPSTLSRAKSKFHPAPSCASCVPPAHPSSVRAVQDETQRLLVREQDHKLEQLGDSVRRVQGMALRVNEELASQNALIDDLDTEMEKTDGRVHSLHRQLKRLANDSDKGKYCVICFLIVLLFFLTNAVLND